MNFVRLVSADNKMYQEAMALYRQSFPEHEQRENASQEAILQCGAYHYDLIYDEAIFVGLLLHWETADFTYIEHFCIDPAMRNNRYGQRALELLGKNGKTIILEIDPPIDDLSIRRRSFYERAGYRENPFSHVHPPYHKENAGHPLTVMSRPDVLTQTLYDKFRLYLEKTIMVI